MKGSETQGDEFDEGTAVRDERWRSLKAALCSVQCDEVEGVGHKYGPERRRARLRSVGVWKNEREPERYTWKE